MKFSFVKMPLDSKVLGENLISQGHVCEILKTPANLTLIQDKEGNLVAIGIKAQG